MAIKVYTLKGTISAGASETELDVMTVPSGRKRTIQEVRVYISATSGVQARLYKNLDYLAEFNAEVSDELKLPYPVNEVLAEGDKLRLTAINTTTSSANIIVEVVVEETAA